MKYLQRIAFVLLVTLTWSCANDDDNSTNNSPIYENRIDIGEYAFYFPDVFALAVETQGFDSYTGQINSDDVSLAFDYGWYTKPAENLSPEAYIVTEDIINGYFQQIVRSVDPAATYTQIHLYNISEQTERPQAYNSLTIRTSGLSAAQQEIIMNVFTTVQIMN